MLAAIHTLSQFTSGCSAANCVDHRHRSTRVHDVVSRLQVQFSRSSSTHLHSSFLATMSRNAHKLEAVLSLREMQSSWLEFRSAQPRRYDATDDDQHWGSWWGRRVASCRLPSTALMSCRRRCNCSLTSSQLRSADENASSAQRARRASAHLQRRAPSTYVRSADTKTASASASVDSQHRSNGPAGRSVGRSVRRCH